MQSDPVGSNRARALELHSSMSESDRPCYVRNLFLSLVNYLISERNYDIVPEIGHTIYNYTRKKEM